MTSRLSPGSALDFFQRKIAPQVLHLLVVGLLATAASAQVRSATPAPSTPSQTTSPAPKRLAILPFNDSAVMKSSQEVFGSSVDVGKGMAESLTRQLMKDADYSVTPQETVTKVMAEQKFSKSDRTDRESAARIGKILGVDLVVIGYMTEFGHRARRTMPDEILTSHTAIVEAEVRVIGVSDGEIEAVASGRGDASAQNRSLLAGWKGNPDSIDFSSTDFKKTLLGQAWNAAVTQMTEQLAADSSRFSSTK